MKIFNRKKRKYTNEYSTHLLCEAFNWTPIAHSFSEKFQKDGMNAYEDELKALQGISVDVFNTDKKDGFIKADSQLERANITRDLKDELSTAKSLNAKRVMETVVVILKDRLIDQMIEEHKAAYDKACDALDAYRNKR